MNKIKWHSVHIGCQKGKFAICMQICSGAAKGINLKLSGNVVGGVQLNEKTRCASTL